MLLQAETAARLAAAASVPSDAAHAADSPLHPCCEDCCSRRTQGSCMAPGCAPAIARAGRGQLFSVGFIPLRCGATPKVPPAPPAPAQATVNEFQAPYMPRERICLVTRRKAAAGRACQCIAYYSARAVLTNYAASRCSGSPIAERFDKHEALQLMQVRPTLASLSTPLNHRLSPTWTFRMYLYAKETEALSVSHRSWMRDASVSGYIMHA